MSNKAASQHIWVGNLPEYMNEDDIRDYFSKFGQVIAIKILPKKDPSGNLAAFIDFDSLESATRCHDADIKIDNKDIRTDYNYDRRPQLDFRRSGLRSWRPHRNKNSSFSLSPSRSLSNSPISTKRRSFSHSSKRSNSRSHSRSRSRSRSFQRRFSLSSDSRSRSISSTASDHSNSHRPVSYRSKKHKTDTLRAINLPEHITDKAMAYEIEKDFKRNYDIRSVRIHGGQFSRKFALIKFGSEEEAQQAFDLKQGKYINGVKMDLLMWDPTGPPIKKVPFQYRTFAFSKGTYQPPYGFWEEGMDPAASRCLFVGNVHKLTCPDELREKFVKFGQVLTVDIKDNVGATSATYAFVQMFNLNEACYAKKILNGQYLGKNRCKVAFGKGTLCSNIWVDGLDPNLSNGDIRDKFSRHGEVIAMAFDRRCGTAIIQFGNRDAATSVFQSMRGKQIGKSNILVDYASQECRDMFYEHLKKIERDRRSEKGSGSNDRNRSKDFGINKNNTFRKYYEFSTNADSFSKELLDYSKSQKKLSKDFSRKKDRPDEHWQTVDEASSSDNNSNSVTHKKNYQRKNSSKYSGKGISNTKGDKSICSDTSSGLNGEIFIKPKRSHHNSFDDMTIKSDFVQINDSNLNVVHGKKHISPNLCSLAKKQFSSDEENLNSLDPYINEKQAIDDSNFISKSFTYKLDKEQVATDSNFSDEVENTNEINTSKEGDDNFQKFTSSDEFIKKAIQINKRSSSCFEDDLIKSKRSKQSKEESGEKEQPKKRFCIRPEIEKKKTKIAFSPNKSENKNSPNDSIETREQTLNVNLSTGIQNSCPESTNVKASFDQPINPSVSHSHQQQQAQALMDLLRRYPVMWQGHLCLKNDSAAVQMHFLAGTLKLAEFALPQLQLNQPAPSLRISQRMRLDTAQLDGVEKRMEKQGDYCLLLALPCGRDPLDVHHQTKTMKDSFIKYLKSKDAAGILNISNYVVHIFPPCSFAEKHLKVSSPDLLHSAADSGHLMILIISGRA